MVFLLSGFPRFVIFVVLLTLGCTFCRQQRLVRAAEADPDSACAPCHRNIYDRYRKTAMANASGLAIDGVIPADFVHPPSSVRYRVYADDGHVWMTYEREAASGSAAIRNPLNGRKELRFYIGSGKRGRTYLFEQEGYWFEAPINWYAKKRLWDMAPNHLADREAPLTMPVDPGCLHCHASEVAASLADARNHYAGAPFAAGGIHCFACHGDSSAHLASKGKIAMLALGALEPVRRDSICLNCHLEGESAIDRLEKKGQNFRPGDNLFQYAAFFVHRAEKGSGGRATSQWEALLQSQCKRKSGDRMTCTSCHDPHGSPPPEQRVMFYRQRCLACHGAGSFAARHHPDTLDCTQCHMARFSSSDIAHEQVTDHRIRKRISETPGSPPEEGTLDTIGNETAADRELGLAYAEMAVRGERDDIERAVDLLSRAEKQNGGAPYDDDLHSRLGFLQQESGHADAAADEYERAIKANPYDSLALGDLALIKAARHQYAEAERLWKAAFEHDPVQIGAGLNVAIVECETGNRREASDALHRVLEFAPDNEKAHDMLQAIETGKLTCAEHEQHRR